jgi:hypothetical protein
LGVFRTGWTPYGLREEVVTVPRPLLQNTESVWWYVAREFEQTLGRPVADDEAVTVTLVVSALTKLLVDAEAAERGGLRATSTRRERTSA